MMACCSDLWPLCPYPFGMHGLVFIDSVLSNLRTEFFWFFQFISVGSLDSFLSIVLHISSDFFD